ncbi:MAG: CXXX repeat peptide maturase [Bacteroides sp.]|nr:CXXX repeat peptide maturase [Ruminococcus flavefaciens]MCM1554883.1 CXXX repeat peptide maturase [Bacteroides sp.]
MLKYLVVQLDDVATSFCHYTVSKTERKPIALEDLRKGILFAMKENLNVQFIYPDYSLPKTYENVIESIDHVKIISSCCDDVALKDVANIVVFNGWGDIVAYNWDAKKAYVLRTSKTELFEKHEILNSILTKVGRLNVVLTDVETLKDKDFDIYRRVLSTLSSNIEKLYVNKQTPQLNLLTDRMMLKEMNNCNAGNETITLAPNGCLYACPAFYYEQEESIGTPTGGLDIKNPQLYKLSFAPICRHCDAYQCKRCVWMNKKTTLEVNTPSHEQCVMAHLERNESRRLLQNIRKIGEFMPDISIPKIDYMDPFEKRKDW